MINCIVAIERSRGIGFKGQMPWPHLKYDMKWFKELTAGNIIIMGSSTFDSLGKRLPNRINVVLSKKKDYSLRADFAFNNPDTALAFCKNEYPDKEIFIIGGGVVYEIYKTVIDKFFITEIDADYQCDVFFDYNYVKNNFTKVREHATFYNPVKYIIKEYNL